MLNGALLKHWQNWAIVPSMVFVGLLTLHLIAKLAMKKDDN